jgi:hypothetical protein
MVGLLNSGKSGQTFPSGISPDLGENITMTSPETLYMKNVINKLISTGYAYSLF